MATSPLCGTALRALAVPLRHHLTQVTLPHIEAVGRLMRLACQELCEYLISAPLSILRRDWQARWEHVERSPEEDHKTHHKNVGGYRIDG
ncbi:hypothetical protein BHM03_00062546, partial [Ensete ventricosum]